jgi:nucleoside-triphosphatase
MIDGRKGALASVESTSPTRVKSVTQGEEVSYGVDLEFLEKVAVQEIRKNLSNSADLFIVIDEIGPMQLNSPLFRDLVLDLLESDKSILFGSVVQRSFDWTDDLKQRPGVETFLLTEQNRETLTKMMAKYLQCR